MKIDSVDFLFQLAVILFSAKMLGILMRRLGLPQVLGFIMAGLLIGPAIWGMLPFVDESWIFPLRENDMLSAFAEVGVIFVMFTAGLETDLKEMKNSGVVSFLVAMGGVLVPLAAGFGIGVAFLGTENLLSCLFVGVIMTATSVGITVETLRELGKLKGKVGTIILSAAIIDDVLGLIVLTVALSLNSAPSDASGVLALINPNGNALISIVWMFAFFVVAIGCGILLIKLFRRLERKHPHTRRIPILSLVMCLIYSFVAEKVFGVAEITGAYIAGVILSVNHASAEYVDRRITINSYMIFAPIFFANIGIKIDFSGLTLHVLWFALAFVAVAIAGKIIGCGGVAKCCKFNLRDSAKIGVGMIARGEVALIVMEKGIAGGLLGAEYRVIVVMLVLVSSVLAPIFLKLLFKHDEPLTGGWKEVEFTSPVPPVRDGAQKEQSGGSDAEKEPVKGV
ncbi:MAG: sodium:proton antiporter [Bacillota bacterium]|nr:MAG: sodium:proton antiporter [Bacillota bacterium]